jgi:hypothetical protein
MEIPMRSFVIRSVAAAAFALSPAFALADTVVIEPEVDTWIMEQPDDSVDIDADVTIGAALPDSVKIVEVPKYDKYGYVVVKKKRVLVDRSTRKVIKVY